MITNNLKIKQDIENNILKLKNQAITLFIKREELKERLSNEDFSNLDKDIDKSKKQLENLKTLLLSKDKNLALNKEQLKIEYDICCEKINDLNLKKFRQEQNQRLLKRIAKNIAVENKIRKKIEKNVRTLKNIHNLSAIKSNKDVIKEVI